MNIEMFLTAKEVEESLERQETATCLAWCHDNKSRLRKMKVRVSQSVHVCLLQIFTLRLWSQNELERYLLSACFHLSVNSLKYILIRYTLVKILSCSQSCLEFSLRIQEFIELIRQNKRMDAVRYVTSTLHYVVFLIIKQH